MKRITFFRSRQKVLPNHIARLISSAPALADLESIPQLRRFGHNVRSRRLFQPVFLESNSAAPAMKRCFYRTAFVAEKILVCAQASSNLLEKSLAKTRGFTSCLDFANSKRTGVTDLLLAFG
jgi:hypothetical protein